MERFLILVSLFALPVLTAAIVANGFSDGIPFKFDTFGIVLAILGFMYLGVSICLRNKQRKLAMNMMLAGEIYFVTGIILFIWFYGYIN